MSGCRWALLQRQTVEWRAEVISHNCFAWALFFWLHFYFLYRVEFQNKFYSGQGFKFLPFTFESILDGRFEDWDLTALLLLMSLILRICVVLNSDFCQTDISSCHHFKNQYLNLEHLLRNYYSIHSCIHAFIPRKNYITCNLSCVLSYWSHFVLPVFYLVIYYLCKCVLLENLHFFQCGSVALQIIID